MNVIISNKYKQQLNTLEIDVSKKLEGEYEVDEILSQFSNYFYNKMIIDKNIRPKVNLLGKFIVIFLPLD